MVKEDRSGWVAVQPEFSGQASSDPPPIKPPTSAYNFFQKEHSAGIRAELAAAGRPVDLGALGRAISERWKGLDSDGRAGYEAKARDDVMRFNRESHLRDVEVIKRREAAQRGRENLILETEDGLRTTRKKLKKDKRKKEKAERRKEKSTSSGGSAYSNSDSDSDDSDDSAAAVKRRKAGKPRNVPSEAVLVARQKARAEKLEKERYIEQRREALRQDRAKQAKRRLDFLLKQSDIFSHFGDVKEDGTEFGLKQAEQKQAELKTGEGAFVSRRDREQEAGGAVAVTEDVETEEADEHEATFLTSQPSTLGHGQMRQYQVEGLNWMIRLQENGVNGILADEMGLGKTLQSISVLVYMQEFKACNGPHLVVVPKSTLSNWMNELARWAPKLSAVRFHGSKEEREELKKNLMLPGQRDEDRSWDVCVTTYEVCNMDRNLLEKFAWQYLVIDEAHRLKNEASTFSRTIRTFETRYRLLLTGTPLQNNLHELWALLNFLVPDVFASAEQFDDWFNLDIDDADEKNKLISQLHKILRPFMLRRLKVDVEKSLPPKHETILFTGMSKCQKKLYKDILMRDVDVLQGKGTGGGGGGGSRTAILNIVMQLRKCAGHPYLFPGVEDRTLPPLGEHLVENCGKLVLLDKLLLRLKELGHRVLLFTQMTRILDILEDYLVMRGLNYCRIDGNTSYEDREQRIDDYNAPGSDKFLFLLSTRAGGLGINLQTADVVVLYDSDWNPQADLQAQDRAHRIGQKREVQVFRLVTEHTIEEKIVERAQQKLKLDAMVVQQGRLRERDKLSSKDLLEAVRFGADKVFKSKDSSITDEDIDMILAVGKQKTAELNEKLKNAEKGDMLDFKLDGSMSTQTFEGVDYSQKDLEAIKAAQAEAQLLGILDMGKRERKTVANYNENQLYQQQIAALQGMHAKEQKKKKKETRLPRYLRLPKLEEWQMFDREGLGALQEEEEIAFRALPERVQMAASGRGVEQRDATPNGPLDESDDAKKGVYISVGEREEQEGNDGETTGEKATEKRKGIDLDAIPPLLSEDKLVRKKELLSEGFVDWGRHHYQAFIKASANYGRNNYSKIALEVGKPETAIKSYSKAFFDVSFGKKRVSEHEYDRAVKSIERKEKRLEDVKGLRRGTEVFLSLFDNPWRELEFTHVNCKDKVFTINEDRYLLCWAHKFGYGEWEAIKMAIRRHPNFRFDYYLKSLSVDAIGRRCEQLMRAAEREVEAIEKKSWEELGAVNKRENQEAGEEGNVTDVTDSIRESMKLPRFKEIRAMKRKNAQEDVADERRMLEKKVDEIEGQMETIQNRLKQLQEYRKENIQKNIKYSDVPDELLPELANLVAKAGSASKDAVAGEYSEKYPGQMSKKIICAKIDEISRKEKRVEEGDTKMVWYVLPDYMNLLDIETIRELRKAKAERLKKEEDQKQQTPTRKKRDNDGSDDKVGGAPGPDGAIVAFPDYDGSEAPRDFKKAFTLFCNGTRREVKASLDPAERKDKRKVNGILKDKWFALNGEEKAKWKKWQEWDERRYHHQLRLFNRKNKNKNKMRLDNLQGKEAKEMDKSMEKGIESQEGLHHETPISVDNATSIPKKGKRSLESFVEASPVAPGSIPKKKRRF